MIFALCCGIVCALICGFVFIYDDYYDIRTILFKIFVSLFFGGIAFLFSYAMSFSIVSERPLSELKELYEFELIDKKDIHSLHQESALDANFVLGSGRINRRNNYYCLIKNEIGYQVVSYSISESYINYTNEHPYVETYEAVKPKTFGAKFFGDTGIKYYIIYIPENSIIENYEIK